MAIQKTKREIKSEQNYKNITATAKALFSSYGFDRVTVDDICAQANVSKSTFYTHFNGKQDLLIVFSAADRNEFLKQHYTYDENKSLRELMSSFFFANFAYNRKDSHDWNRMAYVSYIKLHRQERRENHFYQDELRRLVNRGIEEDAFRSKLTFDEYYRMIHDWIIGFFIGWSVYPDSIPGVDSMYDNIMNAMIDSLLK